jgi:hypothetical protein
VSFLPATVGPAGQFCFQWGVVAFDCEGSSSLSERTFAARRTVVPPHVAQRRGQIEQSGPTEIGDYTLSSSSEAVIEPIDLPDPERDDSQLSPSMDHKLDGDKWMEVQDDAVAAPSGYSTTA